MRVILYVLSVFFISMSSALYAETTTDESKLPKDFLGLADMRGSLNSEIYYLEGEIQELEKRIADIEFLKLELDRTKKTIDEISKKRNQSVADKKLLEESTWRVPRMEQDIKYIEAGKVKLENKKELLSSKRKLASAVQERIASMLSPEQAFKRTMSITFAILIAIVIIGFFIISWLDEKIRQAIFSGQAGIQFLTLFSLVIAIILFGITGILEGKELAALLGGLSGYILGRVTTSNTPSNS